MWKQGKNWIGGGGGGVSLWYMTSTNHHREKNMGLIRGSGDRVRGEPLIAHLVVHFEDGYLLCNNV